MSHVGPGVRAYLKNDGLFGEVVRTNLFNLANAPVILRDDGVVEAFVGQKVVEVVNKTTGSDGVETVTVPLDVRVVGTQVLNAFGVPAEEQASMFTKFVTKLTRAQRDAYASAFAALDSADTAAVSAFVDQMRTAFNAL
jgi:hypothetical protein